MSQEIAKKAAAKSAVSLIEPNMLVGLGSGSTSEYFIDFLIKQVNKGLKISAVSSSKKSEKIAQSGGILIKDINDVDVIDITIDGADEIDREKKMIKGGGGAHIREKILAYASKELVVIVDETKIVDKLGKRKLPVEVLPFGHNNVKNTLEKYLFNSSFRKNKDDSYFITDNQNYILDVDISNSKESVENIHFMIRSVPGVIDTGFFFNLAKRVIIGSADGKTTMIS